MVRRVHKKERTGCTQCKQRRVKCDEGKPSCASCKRMRRQCSFEFLIPVVPRIPRDGKAKVSQIIASKLSPELSPSTYDSQTNELLHHYTTALYASLAGDDSPTEFYCIWCVTIPQIGLEHPFVLSGVLALSALHLASKVPQRKQEMRILALTQESSALPSVRSLMGKPKAENIHAIWIFAASLVYYCLASPDQGDRCRLPSRNDEQPHWFQTTRGFMALLDTNWTRLKRGPFGLMIQGEGEGMKDKTIYEHLNPDDEHFAKLEGMFSSDNLSSTELSGRSVEACKETLKDLRQVAGLAYSSSLSETSLRYWAGTVSQEFAELVYERDPRALVILAYYCVLLKRFDHVWYWEGLGIGLLENIRQALTEEWLPWIQWALDQPVSTIQ